MIITIDWMMGPLGTSPNLLVLNEIFIEIVCVAVFLRNNTSVILCSLHALECKYS